MPQKYTKVNNEGLFPNLLLQSIKQRLYNFATFIRLLAKIPNIRPRRRRIKFSKPFFWYVLKIGLLCVSDKLEV